MPIWIGQNFKMNLEIIQEKGGETRTREVILKLPDTMDGIVSNLPAYLAGLPEEVWWSKFVPAVTEESADEGPGASDEFDELGLGDNLGTGNL